MLKIFFFLKRRSWSLFPKAQPSLTEPDFLNPLCILEVQTADPRAPFLCLDSSVINISHCNEPGG